MTNFDSRYRSLIELSLVPGIGISRIKNLLNKFGNIDDVLNASHKSLTFVDGISDTLAKNIIKRETNKKFIDEQFSKLEKFNCEIVSLWDDEYPSLLKQIYDPPPFIFYRGNINFKDLISIAVIGTRFPSQYGIMAAEKITTELVDNNIVIVSGLARGIDSIAHQTAIKSKGKTIAILGSGLDIIYPQENTKLADKICEDGGIISEFFFGTPPDPKNFPRRNRIISGISNGVAIIESGEKGGAIVTAQYTIEQNRDLFCVPGNISSNTSMGTNLLIKNSNAKLIQNANDILIEYKIEKQNFNIKDLEQLSIFEQTIFDVISSTAIHIDEIAEKVKIPVAEAHVHLLGLEFKNLIRQLPGKYFIKNI